MDSHGYRPKMLEKSRFNRRHHKLGELFLVVLELLSDFGKQLSEESVYAIDSFPMAVCDNYRISAVISTRVKNGVVTGQVKNVISIVSRFS